MKLVSKKIAQDRLNSKEGLLQDYYNRVEGFSSTP